MKARGRLLLLVLCTLTFSAVYILLCCWACLPLCLAACQDRPLPVAPRPTVPGPLHFSGYSSVPDGKSSGSPHRMLGNRGFGSCRVSIIVWLLRTKVKVMCGPMTHETGKLESKCDETAMTPVPIVAVPGVAKGRSILDPESNGPTCQHSAFNSPLMPSWLVLGTNVLVLSLLALSWS